MSNAGNDEAFIAHLMELLEPLGEVRFRKMFGGYGVYHQDVMFALVADEQLYLKVDNESKATFEQAGLAPFTYEGHKKPVIMSYHQAPEAALEDPEEMQPWAELAIAAALRNKASKK